MNEFLLNNTLEFGDVFICIGFFLFKYAPTFAYFSVIVWFLVLSIQSSESTRVNNVVQLFRSSTQSTFVLLF